MTREEYLAALAAPTTHSVDGTYKVTEQYRQLVAFQGALREQALESGMTAHEYTAGRTLRVRFDGDPVVVECDGLSFLATPGEEIISLTLL